MTFCMNRKHLVLAFLRILHCKTECLPLPGKNKKYAEWYSLSFAEKA